MLGKDWVVWGFHGDGVFDALTLSNAGAQRQNDTKTIVKCSQV
jgi:hypothetical protein